VSAVVEVPMFERETTGELAVEHLLDLGVDLDPAQTFATPMGARMTLAVRGGSFSGPRLRGELLPGGGDWILASDDGIGRLDVRSTMRTDDGALIHFEAKGKGKVSPEWMERLAAGERIPYDQCYIRTTPSFETSDERYAWLNELVVVGINELSPDHVDYRLYSVL
jgi:hypothetical protein